LKDSTEKEFIKNLLPNIDSIMMIHAENSAASMVALCLDLAAEATKSSGAK